MIFFSIFYNLVTIKIAIRKREIMEIQNISKKLKHFIENLHEIDEIDEI